MGEWAAWAREGIANGGALATLSYVLLITSMLMGRLLYLRLFAIASGVTGVLYFWLFLGDRVASVWEMLFIAAVLFQLALTAYRDRTTRFDDDETFFRNAAVPGLSPSEARLLLKQGDRRSLPAGMTITMQGQAVDALTFILEGQVAIEVEGRRVAMCGRGDYVGEIGVMSEEPATARAIADGPIRVLSFPAAKLRKFLHREKAIAREMELGFRQGLRQKLVRANAAIAEMAADSAA